MPKISVVIPVYNLETEVINMLQSVKNQIFTDFEVIIIDDGSTDHSYNVVSEYVAEDTRFHLITQKNCGVSATRNRGLDIAKGKYIIFFDGDDFIPSGALKKMYKAITAAEADMAVGIMAIYSDGNFTLNRSSKRLGAKSHINPQDIDFIKTWSQCNKMYKTEFLRKNNIRFLDVKVAEDGHFLYQVLAKFPNICGCNDIVYHYIRRAFWIGEHTASKNVDKRYLYDRNTAYKGILGNTAVLLKNTEIDDKKNYMDKLVSRFIQGGILQAFYKRIWRCEEGIEKELYSMLCTYKNKISSEVWHEIIEKDWEIDLKTRILNGENDDFRKNVAQSPVLSIIVSSGLDKSDLNLTLMSIYNQEFPAFEIIMCKESFELLEDELKLMTNIKFVDKCNVDNKNFAVNIALGRFVHFIDEAVIVGTHTFKNMINKLRDNSKFDFISVYMKGKVKNSSDKNDGYGYRLKMMDIVFGYSDKEKHNRDKINALDNSFTNKIFKKECFGDFKFTNKSDEDLYELYSRMGFEKTRTTEMLTFIKDEEFAERSCVIINGMQLNLIYLKNKLIEPLAGKGLKKLLKKYLH